MSFFERQEYVTEVLQKEHFLEWLDLYQSHQIVGIACTASDCPIASYLLSLGFRQCHVISSSVTANLTTVNTPEWAVDFIEKVDEASEAFITKALAVSLLSKVEVL